MPLLVGQEPPHLGQQVAPGRDPGYAYGAPQGYVAQPTYAQPAYAQPGYGYAQPRARVPDYVAAARAGDSYCQEATQAVRQSAAEAAYTGSPEAASRLARSQAYASRDC